MTRLMPVVALLSFLAAGFIFVLLWRRHLLRRAVKRHRSEIEAFFADFLRLTSRDRDAISDIGIHGSCDDVAAFVYMNDGRWFQLSRRKDGPPRYRFSTSKSDGLRIEQFPPFGIVCDADWFEGGMRAMFATVEAWPREWLSFERAKRVLSGRRPTLPPIPKVLN